MKKLIVSIFIISLVLTGCQENFITSPENNLHKENWEIALEKQGLKPILLPESAQKGLKKTITEKAYADKNNNIDFKYTYVTPGNTTIYINMRLKIFKGALDEDTDITIELDEQYFLTDLSAKFYPSGTSFNIPAELDMLSMGIDFGNDDLSDLKFAYYNENTGVWEEMGAKRVFAKDNGLLFCQDGVIPHFSRFGVIR